MPVFEYSALDNKGKSVTGIIDADGTAAARQKLRSMGKYPTNIKEVKESVRKKTTSSSKEFSLSTMLNRVKPAEVTIMTRQMATLVGAGFPLVSAIDTLIPQTRNPSFKKIIAQIKDSVVAGSSFAASLEPYPNIFSSLYTSMVNAGESSGTLEIVLERLADITEKAQALKSRIQAAMVYPILMGLVAIAVVFLLLTFVVPNITSIFDDLEKALPAPTVFLIGTSNFFKSFWWAFVLAGILIFFGIRSIRKTEKGRYQTDAMLLKLPLFGTILRKLAIARFSRTLGSLLDNGVSMLQALKIVKNIVGNVVIAEVIQNAAEEVEKGQGLGKTLGKSDILPPIAVQMIDVGEQSGNLEDMLVKIADVFETEVEQNIMSMTSLLEPIMILVMGLVVGFIILSIMLPIMEMNQLAG
jgi:general secretion pathway protein F